MDTIATASLLPDPMAYDEPALNAAAEAALAAGFTGASAWSPHVPLLARAGLRIDVIEAAVSWTNAEPEQAAAEARAFAELAATHNATKVVCTCLQGEVADMGRAQENLAVLVETVNGAGAQVCFEFLPWTAVPTLAATWSLVEPLGPAAGFLIDTWHWTRQPGGPDTDLLRRIPGERIGFVQVSDVAEQPTADPRSECMTGRLLPGEGVADFEGLVAALETIGATPIVAAEVFNPRLLHELGPKEAAVRARATMRAVLGSWLDQL